MLSETNRGAAWLGNFAPEDREIARRALDALMILNWSAIRPGLVERVTEVIDGVDGPSWLLPLMAEEDILEMMGQRRGTRLVAHENYKVGAGVGSLPGSEGLIGNTLRGLVRRKDVLSPKTSLESLRAARVRAAIVVTDYSGSGNQVRAFLRILLRNRTLSSWHSFGWLRIHVVAYAVSAEARAAIDSMPELDHLHTVLTAPSISTQPWSATTRRAVIDLARRYPPGAAGLGYRDHGGLYALEESVPNTLPRMFTHRGAGWAPLFDGRLTPTTWSRELATEEPPTADLPVVAREFGQERLSDALPRQMRAENRRILTVLAAFLASRGTRERAERALGVDRREADRVVDYLIASGWLDSQLGVTDAGRSELRSGKARPREVLRAESSPSESTPYYPRSLR